MPGRPALKSMTPQVLVATLAALMAGCGFQLRGAPPVSSALQPLAVECSNDVPDILCQSVLDQLELGDVKLSPAGEAAFVMQLSDFRENRRASAITVQAAAAEYTLRQSVSIELISADRVPMIADTRLTASESYRYDETNVLAKQREEEELRMQLSDRLAQQVIFRLAPLTETRIETIREEHRSASSESDEGAPSQ